MGQYALKDDFHRAYDFKPTIFGENIVHRVRKNHRRRDFHLSAFVEWVLSIQGFDG